jgi:valyl-tRNA synthetase
VGEVLSLVRKAKSEAKVSMRADVSRVVVTANAEVLARVQGGVEDLRAAGRIAELELVASDGPGDAVAVDVELAPEPTA